MQLRSVFFAVLAMIIPAAASPQSIAGASISGVSRVAALAVDPAFESVLYAATDVGVFKSSDRGAHWSPTSLSSFTWTVAVDASQTGTLYAGAPGGFFRSTDGGASWSRMGGGLEGASVLCIAVDAASAVVYAGVTPPLPGTPGPLGLYKSADRGATWRATGLSGLAVAAVTVDPTNPQVLYAAPYVWPVFTANAGRGIVKSADGGATWSPIDNPVGGGPAFRSLAVDPQNPANVYASWFIGIIFKSADAGATWARIEIGQQLVGDSSALAIDPADPSVLYLATNHGVFRSTNGAVTWMPLPGSPQTAISTLLMDRATVFVGIGPGPLGTPSVPFQVYRSSDGGATWTGSSFGCVSSGQNLCLSSGRFDVRVTWTAPSYPGERIAAAVPIVAQTGAFWFFDAGNLELMVKVLDGRAINGRFWVFYGALSNVEYTITVSDTETGVIRSYFNPDGRLASIADTSAF